ncbi:hypothetical protein LG198_02860 [Methylobacillus arboreus]|uniref:hypothetical protein n=1 Tax=Methylobacillus arboreus TaxID=755170 RepID=UPI001E541F7A|nr:hypothetical protein [Methylobacillus arboreus]MCB5189673.1 hypothetical protein [Methylobacillus arboreus]
MKKAVVTLFLLSVSSVANATMVGSFNISDFSINYVRFAGNQQGPNGGMYSRYELLEIANIDPTSVSGSLYSRYSPQAGQGGLPPANYIDVNGIQTQIDPL